MQSITMSCACGDSLSSEFPPSHRGGLPTLLQVGLKHVLFSDVALALSQKFIHLSPTNSIGTGARYGYLRFSSRPQCGFIVIGAIFPRPLTGTGSHHIFGLLFQLPFMRSVSHCRDMLVRKNKSCCPHYCLDANPFVFLTVKGEKNVPPSAAFMQL